MDFITELPPSLGFDAITVFVEHDVTKAMVIVPALPPSLLNKQPNSIKTIFGTVSDSPVNSSLIVAPNSLPYSPKNSATFSASPKPCLPLTILNLMAKLNTSTRNLNNTSAPSVISIRLTGTLI
jgi:hypothetical protein